jgi:hypothetical protein
MADKKFVADVDGNRIAAFIALISFFLGLILGYMLTIK